jgi:hypothetical protein
MQSTLVVDDTDLIETLDADRPPAPPSFSPTSFFA